MIRFIYATLSLLLACALTGETARADVYTLSSGFCTSSVRYHRTANGYERDTSRSAIDCMKEQHNQQIRVGDFYLGGGPLSVSRYTLSLSESAYRFTNGRLKPHQVQTGLEALAFGLLELHMRHTVKLDGTITMKENLSGVRFQSRRQIEHNRAQTAESGAFRAFLEGETDRAVGDMTASTAAATPSIDANLNRLQARLDAASIPRPNPRDDDDDNPQRGPVLSRVDGVPTTSPSVTDQADNLRNRLAALPGGGARADALKTLEFAVEEADTNPELGEALLRHAQALRFVAEGKLPPPTAQPDPLVQSYLDYRDLNSQFKDKRAQVLNLQSNLPADSFEARRSNISLAAADGLDEASQSARREGDFDTASTLTTVGIELLDIGLGFVPIVGTGRDLYELVVGEHLITGEDLDTVDRVLAGVGVVSAGVANRKVIKIVIDKVGPIASRAGRTIVNNAITVADDVARQIGRIGVNTPEIKAFITNPLGRAWAKTRITLNHVDGLSKKNFRRAPPNADLLPTENVFGRALPREHAEAFKNGTGRLSPNIGPNQSEALITRFDDIAGHLTHDGIVRRLTLLDKDTGELIDAAAKDYVVVKFSLQGDFWKLLSERTSVLIPDGANGWIPLGRTQGGAAEFVIGNVPLQWNLIDPTSIDILDLN